MKRNKTKVIELFNDWAQNGRSEKMADGHRFSVKKMLDLLELKKNYHLLEVGCGNGWVVREISENPYCQKIVGVDLSDQMIKIAEQKKSNERQCFLCDDFLMMDETVCFDAILSMEVFYYLSPLEMAVEKAYRLLQSNGCFLMGVDFYKENEASHDWVDFVGLDMDLKSESEWKMLFINAGFKTVDAYKVKDKDSKESWKRDVGTLIIKAKK